MFMDSLGLGKAYSPNRGPSTLILRNVMAPIASEKFFLQWKVPF